MFDDEIAFDDDADDHTEGAPAGVWIGLVLISLVSFWAQAVTTEERFVPALNVIAKHFHIPDDVAGATLMAAGASSPELFSALVSIFITHSSLGLGTVVGSEIFNQLCICAGAVLAARQGTLTLGKAIVIREMFFYWLSIMILLYTLSDHRPYPDDPGYDHLYISCGDAVLMVGTYVLYVLVLWKFDWILSLFFRPGGGDGKEEEKVRDKKEEVTYGAIEETEISTGDRVEDGDKRVKFVRMATPENNAVSFVRQLSNEPRANFHTGKSMKHLFPSNEDGSMSFDSYSQRSSGGGESLSLTSPRGSLTSEAGGTHSRRSRGLLRNHVASLKEKFHVFSSRTADSIVTTFRFYEVGDEAHKPSEVHGLDEIIADEFEDSLSCFLWQQSQFYDLSRTAWHAWQLRWFTFSHDRVGSIPDRNRLKSGSKVRFYPKFDKIEVDEAHLTIKMIDTNRRGKGCVLLAPTTEVQIAVVAKCKELMTWWESHPATGKLDVVKEEEEEAEPRLIDFPVGSSLLGLIFHFILFPIKALMHYTIPDVRCDKDPSVSNAFLASVMCLVWLIVASYFMVSSLETLADLLGVPDSVAGVTVSAAGTSLPNYVASQVAAQQGLGNMAVSNAFGSNIFNILIGLGVPWLLYTTIVMRGGDYTDLRDDGIDVSVIILLVVLLAFAILVAASNFVLYRWHAYAFIIIYLMYVIGEIVSVYCF